VTTIIVPPLRERLDDLPILAEYFLRMYGAHRPNISLASEAMDALTSYYWPGNIRELENVIHGAIVDSESHVISLENIPERVKGRQSVPANSTSSLNEIARRAREDARVKEIKAVLAKNGNNVPETARVFGVSESYIYRVLRQSK